MLLDIIKQCNWMDIFVVILLFRICYIATKFGLPVELFKLLGTILAVYLSLHYYTGLSDGLRQRFGAEKIPLEFLDFLVFLGLSLLGYLIFVSLRLAFYRFIKMEAAPGLNRWGGLVLGLMRGFLLTGLIIFIFTISTISYLKESARSSYSGSRLSKIAPATYSVLWNKFMSKFMPQEKFNDAVLEVQESLEQ